MTDLASWLLAQYDADEATAADWPDVLDVPPPGCSFWRDVAGRPIHEPRVRVLADLAAKRRIVERCREVDHCYECDGAGLAVDVLRALALPLADREGYDPAWTLIS